MQTFLMLSRDERIKIDFQVFTCQYLWKCPCWKRWMSEIWYARSGRHHGRRDLCAENGWLASFDWYRYKCLCIALKLCSQSEEMLNIVLALTGNSSRRKTWAAEVGSLWMFMVKICSFIIVKSIPVNYMIFCNHFSFQNTKQQKITCTNEAVWSI